MNIKLFVDFLKDSKLGVDIVHHEYIKQQNANYFSDTLPINPHIYTALENTGIEKFFTHQGLAIQAALDNKDLLVTTPTSSGKTMIYNIPVINTILAEPQSRALYQFPYKALGQDQLKTLRKFLNTLFRGKEITAEIYDGDVTRSERERIRRNPPNILITNPDMLHFGIMAYHDKWETFYRNLRYVVLDELHVYRGIFGCNCTQILRRLQRICRYYGSRPQIIASSATVSNPDAFGKALTGLDLQIISENGAPREGQHFLFVNPELRTSTVSTRLFEMAVRWGFKTIAFTKARRMTELIYSWLIRSNRDLKGAISSYRAGFLPTERREIERKLFRGELMGVISTSALELGIDIGGLDVCILVGYPGTITSTLQRAGRVGRRSRESLVILVAQQDALDQYFMNHPKEIFTRQSEAAIVDPENVNILKRHLVCAASELPVKNEESSLFSDKMPEILKELSNEHQIAPGDDGERWFSILRNPQLKVNIRSMGESFTIYDEMSDRTIGSIDGHRVYHECHEGAVYLHMGRQYQVSKLDIMERNVYCKTSHTDYYTQPMADKETEILSINRSQPMANFLSQSGRVKVTEIIHSYTRKKVDSGEILSHHPLVLPPQTFETIAVWFTIEDLIKNKIEQAGLHFMGGIHAIEHALIGIFPLFSLSDRNDLGGISYPAHPQLKKAGVFLYDSYPGGIGLCERGFTILEELMQTALDIIRNCTCSEGCPACIYSPKCGSGNKPLDKKAAQYLLEYLLNHRPLDRPLEELSNQLSNEDIIEGGEPVKEQPGRMAFFDLETQRSADEVGGWNNAHLMRVSVAVVYDTETDEYHVYEENEIVALIDHLNACDLVVGFNIKRFDYKVLSGYSSVDFKKIPTFDILEDVTRKLGHRVALDNIAKETLEVGKSATGLDALRWFKEGKMDEITKYCKKDVEVTKDLFMHGVEKGHVFYSGRYKGRQKLNVEWKHVIPKQRG